MSRPCEAASKMATARHEKVYSKKCDHCGKHFTGEVAQKFCGDQCRWRWNNWQRRKKKVYVKTDTFAEIVPWNEREKYQLSPYSENELRLIDV